MFSDIFVHFFLVYLFRNEDRHALVLQTVMGSTQYVAHHGIVNRFVILDHPRRAYVYLVINYVYGQIPPDNVQYLYMKLQSVHFTVICLRCSISYFYL